MQRSLKRNSLIVLIITIIAMAATALIFSLFSSVASSAEGNDALRPGGGYDIRLELDANGKSAEDVETLRDTSGADSGDYTVNKNNTLHIKRRMIASNVVVERYNAAHTGQAGFTELNSGDGYTFVNGSVKNDSSAFEVTLDEFGSYIFVTAKEYTAGGNFSVQIVGSTGAPVSVYFNVLVHDTFAQLGGDNGGWSDISDSSKAIYVGNKLNNQLHETSPSFTDSKHASVLPIYNHSKITIDLSELLLNRALYCNSKAVGTDNTKYATVIKMGGTGDKLWGISSVTNFKIDSISFIDKTPESIRTNPTAGKRVTPTATLFVDLTASDINKYTGAEYTDLNDPTDRVERFWSSTHEMTVTLSLVTATGITGTAPTYSVKIPVTFYPANPQVKSIGTDLLSLNVESEYGYDIANKNYYDATGKYTYTDTDDGGNPVEKPISPSADAGYSSVIIRPSDIIEYSYPTVAYGGIMRFIKDECDQSTSDYTIDKLTDDSNEERPEALKVTAKSNGSYNIKFVVEYRASGGERRKKDVTVTFTGYGHYSITLPSLNSKKAVSYNVLSASEFAALRSDGYQMTKAESLNPDQLAVTLSDNILKLDPNVDRINGQTTAQVRLTFTNYNSQSVVLTSNVFNINVEAGSFWARFEDWQAWLIIAACILGGIILILFIVWIFIHSISKHKQDELATQAPVSSYIVKLNSSIAATQAQQRLAATQALSQASTQMLLGAGPTGTGAPLPDMLQLASGIPSQPAPMDSTPSMPSTDSTPSGDTDEDIIALIAKYITDEELLERIFTEKYEPKGMVRRTFFKSKDLQARELDKEKKRIIERYKTPMPMDEAIMSENEIKKSEQMSRPSAPSEPKDQVELPEYVYNLGFDVNDPLYVEPENNVDEFSVEKIDLDASPEEAMLKNVERQNDIIQKEIEELKARLDKVQAEMSRISDYETDLRARIAKAEADDEQYKKDIEDLEFKLASAKSKDKDRITRDIHIKEEQKARNLDYLEKLRAELEGTDKSNDSLAAILEKLTALHLSKQNEQQGISANLDKAQSDYSAYQDRMAKVKARQELAQKVEGLSPLLVAVNTADYEMRELQAKTEKLEKDRENLKSEVAAAKSQILGATDFDVINDLNSRIADANAGLSDLEKVITKTTKRKSELNVEFNSHRRKANDFVEKNEIPLEEVIAAEDLVIGNIELDKLKAEREQLREEAEQNVAKAQAVYDDLAASSNDVTMIAMEVAANIKDLEDELEEAKAALDAVNAQMESASDDEKLLLMVEQGDKSDKIEELTEKLKQANVEGTKRKMEAQSEYDAQLEEARQALDEANEEFKTACSKYDDLANNTNPVDLIISGSGVISQDQKKIDAESLKKQLDKSKNEIEQARLAAQMAQMEAEQARIDAAHASDELKAEAERRLQEALEAAEAARLEAEQKARSEIEAAEAARLEAEEAAERAKQEAEEAAERAKQEAEEALATETEEARRRAMEESEEARRQAQEEIEEMRRKSEEEAEAKRLEEENRRKEEAERQKADEERKAAIAKKIQVRKEQIIAVRNNMKDIKNEDDAKNMREQLYTSQLSFDEDERGSTELMDFYNKTMDDIQNAGEIAKLKAENAKKPQRVIKKVTERVNRIPRKSGKSGAKAGARPGSRPGARPAARPGAKSGVRAGGARPAARPGARPTTGARPGSRPGARPSGTRPPSGNRPK